MAHFIPCKDRNACTEDGPTCKGCGRSLSEITQTRIMVAELVNLINAMQYDNAEDFMKYLVRKVLKKINHKKDS